MIIRCPECSTGFRLPDDRVTEDPIKVRCSKCSHVFQVGRDDEDVPTLFDTDGQRLPDSKQRAEVEGDQEDDSQEDVSAADSSQSGSNDANGGDFEDPYSTQMGTPVRGNASPPASNDGKSTEGRAPSREPQSTQRGSPHAPPGSADADEQEENSPGAAQTSSRDHQKTLHGVPGSTDEGPSSGDGTNQDGAKRSDDLSVQKKKPVDQTQQGTPARSDRIPDDGDEKPESPPPQSPAETIVPGENDSDSNTSNDKSTNDKSTNEKSKSSSSDYNPFPHAGSDVAPLDSDSLSSSDDSEDDAAEERAQEPAREADEGEEQSLGAQASAQELLEEEEGEDFLAHSGDDDENPESGSGVTVQADPPDESPDRDDSGYDVGETVITDTEGSEDQVSKAKKDGGDRESRQGSDLSTGQPQSTGASGAKNGREDRQPNASSANNRSGASPRARSQSAPRSQHQKDQFQGQSSNRTGTDPMHNTGGGSKPSAPAGANTQAAGAGANTQAGGARTSSSGPHASGPAPNAHGTTPGSGTHGTTPGSGTHGTTPGSGAHGTTPGSGAHGSGAHAGPTNQRQNVGSTAEPSGDWVLDEVDQVDAEQFGSSGVQRLANALLIGLLVAGGFVAIVAAQNDWLVDFKQFGHMMAVAFQGETFEPREKWTKVEKVPITQTDDSPVEIRNVFAQTVTLDEGQSDESVLVLKGTAKNIAREDFLGVKLRGKVYDERGKNIKETVTHLGADLPPSEIASLDSSSGIDGLLPKESSRLSADETEPFTVIFDSVPTPITEGKNVRYEVVLAEDPVPTQSEE